jgi:hypothetical protein
MKVLLTNNPLAPSNRAPSDFRVLQHQRPAWIRGDQAENFPGGMAFRLHFDLSQDAKIRVHVSADERYLLYVDGIYMGRGPERGSNRVWFYETYDLKLTKGSHRMVALVWQLGDIAPLAQVHVAGGFLLEAEEPYNSLLSTKSGRWEFKPIDGIRFHKPEVPINAPFFVQPIQTTDGVSYPWGIEHGIGGGWQTAIIRHEDVAFPFGIYAAHHLQPASLPEQLSVVHQVGCVRYVSDKPWQHPQSVQVAMNANLSSEIPAWQSLLSNATPLTIPSHSHRHVIIDLEQYFCAYPQLCVSGGVGSCVTIGWAEALYWDAASNQKGHRDSVHGHTFIALCRDVFMPDGGTKRGFEPLWWRSGRFIQLLIETADEPLIIESFRLKETRYPLEMQSQFRSSDLRLEALTPVLLRGLQMCAHETYMDCPYYEQLMYVADTRLEALVTYVISPDNRLARKAISLFNSSRLADGFVQARYPSRDVQIIPPFALWWIGMVYDYALWRGERSFIKAMLPGIRSVLDGFLQSVYSENLLQALDGWNFADWTPEWPLGVPPDGFSGFSSVLNWHLVYTLGLAAKLEEWVGEPALAERWKKWRSAIAAACNAHFWDEQRGLFADDKSHTSFSEHTQCLAILSGILNSERYERIAENLRRDTSLTQATIYFTHYLFEAYYQLKQPQAFFNRMQLWFNLPEQGFKTTPEQPEPSRSDCHGWGAHPLYHYFATILGVRPASFGFEQVEVTPMPGHLTHLAGELIHPRGFIKASLHFEGDSVQGQIVLPAHTIGTFVYAGKTQALKPGLQQIDL